MCVWGGRRGRVMGDIKTHAEYRMCVDASGEKIDGKVENTKRFLKKKTPDEGKNQAPWYFIWPLFRLWVPSANLHSPPPSLLQWCVYPCVTTLCACPVQHTKHVTLHNDHSICGQSCLGVVVWHPVAAVEFRTRNQVRPGSNPPLLPFRRFGNFCFLHWCPCWLSCIDEYLAVESGGNVIDLVVARNCCLARMLPGEDELVSEWTGLPGMAKSVFSALSGPTDWILHYIKNYLF